MIRALAVTFGGQGVLTLSALASAASIGAALKRGRRPRIPAVLILGGTFAYEGRLAPWMRTWGATATERDGELPGDELVPDPGLVITQAIGIEAPAAEVWPWLAQIGQDRGGFYSYEWLENLAGCEMRNAERIHPEWQKRELGEEIPLHPATPGPAVTRFEPGRVIGLEGWGVFVLQPEGDRACRLIARGRIPRGAPTLFYRALLEVPHFVMQRKMLIGIKGRAESADKVGPSA